MTAMIAHHSESAWRAAEMRQDAYECAIEMEFADWSSDPAHISDAFSTMQACDELCKRMAKWNRRATDADCRRICELLDNDLSVAIAIEVEKYIQQRGD